MIRPWLMLYRRRLIAAACLSIAMAMFSHLFVSGESPLDVGVFWHHFCGCPPDPRDVRALLYFPLTALFMGMLLGFVVVTSPAAAPGARSTTLFLLTRPMPRVEVLLAPLLVSAVAIATLPLLGMLLLVGWLHLVHAPSLGNLLAVLRQLPAVSALGPSPSFGAILEAIDLPRRWAASVSLGLCAYCMMASQRWLALSGDKRLQILGALPGVAIMAPMAGVFGDRVTSALMMLPAKSAPLVWVPSVMSIEMHLAFAAAVVCGCWKLTRTVEM